MAIEKKEYTILGGIAVLLVILASGATMYVQDAGTKTGCRAGWEDKGEAQYGCTTASGERIETCYEVYDSSGTENYWCKRGNIIKIEQPPEKVIIIESSIPPEPERVSVSYGSGVLWTCNKEGCIEKYD